jgi:predicted dehydrogenase
VQALPGARLAAVWGRDPTFSRAFAERGACPDALDIQASGLLAPSGVDQRVSASLRFPGGVTAQFVCAFDTVAGNSLHIFGGRGAICVPETFWEGRRAQLLRPGLPTLTVETPLRINGFEEEIEDAQRCVRAGLLQSPRMPHAESLALARDLEHMRRQLGVAYPFDVAP